MKESEVAHSTLSWTAVVILVAWPLLSGRTTAALDIELSFSGGFENRPAAVAAMQEAAAAWERVLSDPIIVEIHVREASIFELPFGTDGGTFPTWYEETYPLIREALVADATSPDDKLAIQHLQPGPQMRFQTWDADQNVVINEGNDHINNWILLPRANLKALGIPIEEGDPDPDAEILWSPLSLSFFDYDRTDGVDGRDFVSVAMHEIGHALGFSSGADDYDYVFADAGFATPENIHEFSVVRTLDLFRYSPGSLPLPDLTPGAEAYFSIDGGAGPLGQFATGEIFGDGWQAGHWQFDSSQGLMEPSLSGDGIQHLSPLDLRAMDVIGWDLARVPEPDGIILGLLALIVVLMSSRRSAQLR